MENLQVATFFLFIIFTKLVAMRTSRLSVAPTPRHSMARSPALERVMALDSFRIQCGNNDARFLRQLIFSQISRTDIVHATGGEDTLRRTHIFLSDQCSVFDSAFTRTCVRVAQGSRPRHDSTGCTLALSYKSSTLTARFTDDSSTSLTHFHHFVPRHYRRHRTHC